MFYDEIILIQDEELNVSLIKNGNNLFSTRLRAALDYKKSHDKTFRNARLAKELGIDIQSISRYLSGGNTPRNKRIEEIARILDVRKEYLLCKGGFMTDEEIRKELVYWNSFNDRNDIQDETDEIMRSYIWSIVRQLLTAYLLRQGIEGEELRDAVDNYDFDQYNEAVYDIACYIRDRIRRQTFDNKRPERKEYWKYSRFE